MTVKQAMVIQASTHPAEQFRQMIGSLVGTPFGSFAGGTQSVAAGGGHGVVGSTDLAVVQHSTPNMSVDVPGGSALVRGTQSANQQVYTTYNDGTVTLTISAADPTNPRRDLVVMSLQDAFYSGVSNQALLQVVTGTPAGSPVDPTPPANSLVLARVAVAALATSITNANITDLRTRAYALGGVGVTTSALRPNPTYTGQTIAETDTTRLMTYDGAAWQRVSAWSSTGRTGCQVNTSGAHQTIPNTTLTTVTFNTVSVDTDSFHSGATFSLVTVPTGLGGLYAITARALWDGSPGATNFLLVNIGGTDYVLPSSNTTTATNQSGAGLVVPLSPTNTCAVKVYQNSGVGLSGAFYLDLWRMAI